MARCWGLFGVAVGVWALVGTVVVAQTSFPPPFDRVLALGDAGQDVFILQNLIRNNNQSIVLQNASAVFDNATQAAVVALQQAWGLSATGVADATTLATVLTQLSWDRYVDDGRPASARGYAYKILVPVHRNRSLETTAELQAANGTVLYRFQVRAHGYNSCQCDDDWPNFHNDNPGLNMFTSNGNTVTGLIMADLNSPEPDPKSYGPYPINRAVQGLEGNAAWLVPNIRDGLLLHTGEWPNWSPGEPMPNSEGCMHAYPESIDTIYKTLVSLGVVVHTNPGGVLPYPYKSQGLFSIYQVD